MDSLHLHWVILIGLRTNHDRLAPIASKRRRTSNTAPSKLTPYRPWTTGNEYMPRCLLCRFLTLFYLTKNFVKE